MSASEQRILVFSGYFDRALPSVESFCPARGEWTMLEGASVNNCRTKFAAVPTSRGTVLILGGKTDNGERSDLVEEFDPVSGVMTEIARMPKPLSGFAAVEAFNRLYVIGGNDGRVRATVDVLDLSTLSWSRGPSLNEKRDELAATLGPDGHIYAVGGYGMNNNQCLVSAERLSLNGGSWEQLPAMN